MRILLVALSLILSTGCVASLTQTVPDLPPTLYVTNSTDDQVTVYAAGQRLGIVSSMGSACFRLGTLPWGQTALRFRPLARRDFSALPQDFRLGEGWQLTLSHNMPDGAFFASPAKTRCR